MTMWTCRGCGTQIQETNADMILNHVEDCDLVDGGGQPVSVCDTPLHDQPVDNPRPRPGMFAVMADMEVVEVLCRDCATCVSPACVEPGVVLDGEYDEPWCRRHANEFTDEEKSERPDIVALDSERYRKAAS